MEATKSTAETRKKSIFDHFGQIEDPRVIGRTRHNFMDIITISICAVISGANDWNEIEVWAQSKEEWLKTFLHLPNGIPTHDTYNRVFSAINPKEFLQCFTSWLSEMILPIEGKVVAIDGKTLRRSGNAKFPKSALHLVSAWVSDLNIILGQVKTDEKSNEITAIPELLDLLSIQGCIVAIDAMGCQKKIAEKIVDKGADYMLALKANQGDLFEDVKTYFEDALKTEFKGYEVDRFTTIDKDHGRFEKRTYLITDDINWIHQKKEWKELNSIVMVISERECDGKKTTEERYFLSTLKPDAQIAGNAIRSHWAIENNLHWQLDVHYKEDQSRIRAGNGAENFASMRRISLSLLKQEPSKISLKNKRLKAGWDNNFLLKIIGLTQF